MKNLDNYIFPINTIICILTLCAVVFTMTDLGWKPCPMCLLQQLSVLCILVVSILGIIKKSPKIFSLIIRAIIILVVILGLYIAADQVYLQYFANTPPPTTTNIASCGGIDNPFLLSVTKSVTGSVESCSEISEQISGYSLAVYSLIFFICLLVINCIGFFIKIFKK
ncbi:disulfide bond formation protein B [Francisella sp. 19X1-34]|uniref:disulfide bond formation protein B n=1 Tax=Francisella sp. 19X1-34 TaxID=3087177 RepID=UPI002E350065|nr:disulfide bond formation protein B [Francisella sp. 19X1-34]MED7788178.1 disulfide bond formation protein B [Francisella sp. 19X1-34]